MVNLKTPAVAAAASITVAVTVLAGCAAPSGPDNPGGAIIATGERPGGYRGAYLQRPYAMPEGRFTATDGRSFDFRGDARTPVTLVFFGYTHCPDLCNTVLADVAAALRRVDPAVRAKVSLVFVTTDPERDPPAVIREYLDRFDASFLGVTGPMPLIEAAARQLGVPLTGPEKVPGGYEVGHGVQVVGFVGQQGRVVWTQGTPVGDLTYDFAKLARAA